MHGSMRTGGKAQQAQCPGLRELGGLPGGESRGPQVCEVEDR